MNDPRVCQCGCESASRQTVFLVGVFKKRVASLIREYADKPRGFLESKLARSITILQYLEGAPVNTLQRLQNLLDHHGVEGSLMPGFIHEAIDTLDRKAGVSTVIERVHDGSRCRKLTVGERIIHHETLVNNPNYFFWLGEVA